MFYLAPSRIIAISSIVGVPALSQIIPVQNSRNLAALEEAEKIGFNETRRERYWTEWRKDVTCSANSEWRPLVEACAHSKNLGLRSWGLARLVEAGDIAQFPEYADLINQSMMQPGKDWRTTFLDEGCIYLPGAWQIRRESPFWALFKKTVMGEGGKGIRPELYAIWSKNSSYADRDLVSSLANEFGEKGFIPASPSVDPWLDLRFWMVMDWLCVFGDRNDWESILSRIQTGSSFFTASQKLYSELKNYPCFWTLEEPHDQKDWNFPKASKTHGNLIPSELSKRLKKAGEFSFTLQIGPDGKVVRCRPNPELWVTAGTTMGIRGFSLWEFVYPKVQKDKWPKEGRFIGTFVLR